MKYTKLKYLIFAILALQIVSCEKEIEDIGETIESVPHIEMLGANPVFHLKGLDYVDAGIHAEEYTPTDTIEILEYNILGGVDDTKEGTYTLTYDVKNQNGISFYAHRVVNVVDFTGYDIFEIPSGEYDGIRVNREAGGVVQIEKIREGIYSCSDIMGGYYDQFVGYGPDYTAPALFIINENGEIRSELGSSPWGRMEAQGISFNESTNQLSYYMAMLDQAFGFDVVLTLKSK